MVYFMENPELMKNKGTPSLGNHQIGVIVISKFTVRPDFDLHQGWTNFAEEVNSRCGKRCLGQLENPRTKWRF